MADLVDCKIFESRNPLFIIFDSNLIINSDEKGRIGKASPHQTRQYNIPSHHPGNPLR